MADVWRAESEGNTRVTGDCDVVCLSSYESELICKDKTDGQRMLRAMKYSCVVVSSNGTCVDRLEMWRSSRCLARRFACTCASGFFNRQVSVVHVPVYL